MGIVRGEELTYTKLQQLDFSRTLCLQSVSALEVHGPHLPLGMDLFMARWMAEEAGRRFAEAHPDWTVVLQPHLPVGTDELPLPGSMRVRPTTFYRLLRDHARSLVEAGYRYIVLTTGLGTGLVVDGQVYRGRFGAAGELGHWLSGQARSRKEAQDAEDTLSLRAMIKGYQATSGRNEDFWRLLEQARAEDPYAIAALDRLAWELGRFVANLCVAFDPAVVVLGGPGAEAWPWLESPLRRALRDLAFLPEHAELPVKPSAFGHLASAMGAAALVLQRFLADGGARLRSPPTSHRVPSLTVGA
jgi:hypothetical protein